MEKKKAKKPRKSRIPRTRNNSTMTEAQFWSHIRSSLRQVSRWWKPISQCKINARRKYVGPIKRRRWEYKCNKCGEYFPENKIEVHHTFGVGGLSCYEDLSQFVKRLFVEVEDLECLCENCHSEITKKEKK